jgi:CubicO group peptidase (beta-lactamase class C family)
MKHGARTGFLAVLALLVALAPAVAQVGPLDGLDAYIEREMAAWNIPGLAIAVVHGDSVVHARGFGVRELGQAARVDARTVFAIGSASKAFTAAALGILVDEGAIAWSDPATRHLPGFQLFDPYATRELTVRDLLSHRSGLARGDQLWYATDLSRDEILRRTRYLEPSWGFREQFGYQNLMYLAAGQIVPAVTGVSWDDYVAERIFAPLGMTTSNTSTHALAGMTNVASPHAEVDEELRPIPWRNIDNIAPAGSINSNALDMAQWVRLQLAGGEYRGIRHLSEASIAAMHTPETVIRIEGSWASMAPASHFMTYGLGWVLNDHRGRKVVQHGGNIDGMHALVGMLPEEDVGVVILTNRSGNSLTYALMYRVFDAYMDEPPTDWSGRLMAQRDSLREAARVRQREAEQARVPGTRPTLELERYAGVYRHPMYGDIEIEERAGRLEIRRGTNFTGHLDHWHYDTFRAIWTDPVLGRSAVTFSLDARAVPARLEVQGLGGFARVRDRGPGR